MSIKTVNALSHYTDWTIGHVHAGALGWVAFIAIGSTYYLIPRMFGKTEMHSKKLIELHFWIATLGIVLYIASMWIAGVMQGLMWGATNPDGTLTYSFVEGGQGRAIASGAFVCSAASMFLTGMLLMAWNMVMTMRGGRAVNDAPVLAPAAAH